jgi:hypothetical protein
VLAISIKYTQTSIVFAGKIAGARQESRIRPRDERRDKVISASLSVPIKKPPLAISRGIRPLRQPEFDSNQI